MFYLFEYTIWIIEKIIRQVKLSLIIPNFDNKWISFYGNYIIWYEILNYSAVLIDKNIFRET